MTAFLFTGQGSQRLGMGKEILEAYPDLGYIYDTASDILGYDLKKVIFESTDEELAQTKNSQPAIMATSLLCFEAAKKKGITFDAVAGHSLGEYAAMVVAGALSFEEALPFIKTRGQVFYEAFQKHPSAMGAIIGIQDETVLEVLKKVGEEDGENLYIANYNGPGQLVVTGARMSIKKACKILKEMGAKRAIVLPMKGVGHSPNSAEEGAILAEELKKLHFMKPQVPIYQDVDGLPHTDPKEILDNQIKLMTYPVKWTDITMNMARDGVSEFYEVGTDDTLQKIVKRMVPEAMVTSLLRTPIYEGKIHDFSIINN